MVINGLNVSIPSQTFVVSIYSFQRVAMATESKVTLKSSDKVLFEVNEPVALESQMIKNIIEDAGNANAIALFNVSSNILSKVIEYCEYRVKAQKHADEKSAFSDSDREREFVKVDDATLFHLILVFLNYFS